MMMIQASDKHDVFSSPQAADPASKEAPRKGMSRLELQAQKFKASVDHRVVSLPPAPINITCFPSTTVAPEMMSAIVSACDGIANHVRPQPIEEGMGGTYFVKSSDYANVAVFKPLDEEPCAPNNPKGLSGSIGDASIKQGVKSGEQAIREVAAYMLDHSQIAGVPPTALVSMSSDFRGTATTKIGSLQVFRPSSGTSEDFSAHMFQTRQVQAIALLDMRLLNTDRHDGNILVQRLPPSSAGDQNYSLVPIDHGCVLPDRLIVHADEWTWLSWPQLKQPLSEDLRSMILDIDPSKDARLLDAQLKIRPECVRNMEICTLFVQLCVRFGARNLFEIAKLMCREEEGCASSFEKMVRRCRWRAAAICSKSISSKSTMSYQHAFRNELESEVRRALATETLSD
eukprot:c20477_g1_i1.p1 GENE.c20477_g1_i1~~c20477_g1_i1.p1  ORF type:complete len:400 (+),score=78.11 c20477_g1_i1:149-1348(+)